MKAIFKKLLRRYKHHKMCKKNHYRCPECIYRDFVWEGAIFRGNRCRYLRTEE